MDSYEEESVAVDDHSVHEQLLALSLAAVQGRELPKTIQLKGLVQQNEVLILIDSGSSNTFINSVLAAKLQGEAVMDQPVNVKVADGALLQCKSHIPALEWHVQECSFISDAKVIPLGHYDMIVNLSNSKRY